ncbi:MAG TPA: M56 family metallopeptidase [Acidobacteriaceae bacterium]|nr:M56 family metallopeptidase [Acidobacteriaceae bacterium]
MTTLEPRILAYLANSLWQIPLVFLAGWLAARLVRPAGPAAEHRVWIAFLILQIAAPVASTFSWQPLWMRLVALLTAPDTGPAHVSVSLGPGIAFSPARLSVSLLAPIAAAYLLVCAWLAARFLWRCAHLRTLRRSVCPLTLPADAAQFLAQCSRRFHLSGVSLASSSRIAGPIALGFRRPLILFPEQVAAGLNRAEFEAALAHELAHLRRGDFLRNLLCELIALPAAWHPAVWLTRQHIAETRELACDRMAAEVAGSMPYAQSLLRLASRFIPGAPLPTPHALGIFDTAAFERRIMRLTETPTPIGRTRRLMTLAACVALGLATCGSALALGLHPGASPAAAAAPSKAEPTPVSSRVTAGNRIGGPMPVYPEAAKKAHIQGEVILQAVISRKGNVEHVDVVSGPQELQKSALDAVHTWKYRPYRLKGKRVAVTTTIHVVYTLGGFPPPGLPGK